MKKLALSIMALLVVFMISGMAYADEDVICAQVITYGLDPETGDWLEFPTPCDVPEGWETSTTRPADVVSPDEDGIKDMAIVAPFSCDADCNGDGVSDRKDLNQKKRDKDKEFKTWKKDCWKSQKACGDYNADGKVNNNDLKAKKADKEQEVETWKKDCWLPEVIAQSELSVLAEKNKVSECGGFDTEDADSDTEKNVSSKDERLIWEYDKKSKTLKFLNKNVWLNCCGERSVTMSLNDETGAYEIYETDKAEMDGDEPLRCDCECFFDFKVSMADVDSGIIKVKLFRIITENEEPMFQVWEGDADLSQGQGDILIEKQSGFVSAADDGAMKYYALAEDDAGAAPESNDVAREIEEADIIKIDGTNLYILNRYRGLFVCDISQPDNPSVTGQVSVIGNPVEMYIRENLAYVIVSDLNSGVYPLLGAADSALSSASEPGSRIDVLDISDKTKPKIADSFNLEGEVTDSRIVGDILYVVSSESSYYYWGPFEPMMVDDAVAEDATSIAAPISEKPPERNIYVASLNVSDPNNIREVDREDFTGAAVCSCDGKGHFYLIRQ